MALLKSRRFDVDRCLEIGAIWSSLLFWFAPMFVSALSNLLKFDFVFLFFRLKEVIYSQEQLYLVFEYVEFDLKKYMRTRGNEPLPRE